MASTTTHASRPLVSVILSFRNEEEVIPELVARLQQVFANIPADYELIFINDASTDRSVELLMQKAKEDPAVKLINMSNRFGVSECALAGMRYASGDAIVMMDADLQDPPEVIPQLVEKWRTGVDVVYTIRTAREGESAAKMFITRMAYKAIRCVSNTDLPENAGDFRLMSRRVVTELLKLNEKDPYLRGLVRWMGFKQEPVFYKREARFGGETHFPLLKSKGPLITFVFGFTSFSVLPMVFFLLLGLALVVGSAAGALAALGMKLCAVGVPKMAWVYLALGFTCGLQLSAVGTVGLYVGRIFNDVRNRPRYIVESTAGFSEQKRKEAEGLDR